MKDSLKPLFRWIEKEYGVGRASIQGDRRTADIILARHVCMFLLMEKYGYSSPQAGRVVHRNHASVLNGHRKIKQMIYDGRLVVAEFDKHSVDLAADAASLEQELDTAFGMVKHQIIAEFKKDAVGALMKISKAFSNDQR